MTEWSGPDAVMGSGVNMHCHTSYSFNAYGFSPINLAHLAQRNGYFALGIVDFDVLDGVDEYFDACDRLSVRCAAGIESRVFLPEYATSEINSPGEPGICYHMGIGFARSAVPEEVRGILIDLQRFAQHRNREMVKRINAVMGAASIDYEADVLPLTPCGNATERHILAAYLAKAIQKTGDPLRFWSQRLSLASQDVAEVMRNSTAFEALVRSRLMKRGGPGYALPDSGAFPRVEDFHRLILGCGALPCAAWLDGSSPAEQDPVSLLEFMVSRGVAALNIIPDRNWNVTDPEARRWRVAQLHLVVRLAAEMDLPLIVGTEMNAGGQKLVDDFLAPEMAPLAAQALAGAAFIYGHTVMERSLALGYNSPWAQSYLREKRARNEFFMAVGRCVHPGGRAISRLGEIDREASPSELLAFLGA
jgi:hypothetical protein